MEARISDEVRSKETIPALEADARAEEEVAEADARASPSRGTPNISWRILGVPEVED